MPTVTSRYLWQLCERNGRHIHPSGYRTNAPSQFSFGVLQHAHATFMNILRFGLRPAGFIFMPRGLLIKMPESYDYPAGHRPPLIFLSNHADRIMEFFGLPKKCWSEVFESTEQYWHCVTSAKYFSRELFASSMSEDDLSSKISDSTTQECKRSYDQLNGYCLNKEAWTHFVTSYLPANPAIGSQPVNY